MRNTQTQLSALELPETNDQTPKMGQRGDAKPEEAVHMFSKYSAEHGSYVTGFLVCCFKKNKQPPPLLLLWSW